MTDLKVYVAAHSVNAALRSGVKAVFGITHLGLKFRICAYRLKQKGEYKPQGKSLATGNWIDVQDVEIEPV